MRFDNFGGDEVLQPKQLQDGNLVLGAGLAHFRHVAQAKVLQFPDDLQVKVAAREVIRAAVRAAAKEAATERAAGFVDVRLQHHAGDERPRRSALMRSSVACTTACWEASSGRLVRPIGMSSSTTAPGGRESLANAPAPAVARCLGIQAKDAGQSRPRP